MGQIYTLTEHCPECGGNEIQVIDRILNEEIREYEKLEGSELNPVKERLAFELTKMIHGEEEARKALATAKSLFAGGSCAADMPETELTTADFTDGEITVLDLLLKAGLIPSKGEGRRLVQQGGITVKEQKVTDPFTSYSAADFAEDFVIKKGKKVFHKIVLK